MSQSFMINVPAHKRGTLREKMATLEHVKGNQIEVKPGFVLDLEEVNEHEIKVTPKLNNDEIKEALEKHVAELLGE